MSKILIISVTILAIVLAIIGGYYTVELAKLMGANLLRQTYSVLKEF
jgi:hypothetical protein